MRNEIVFSNVAQAIEVMKILLDNDYVCLMSYEENLTILNYEWSPYANRNGVVFMSREDYDCEMDKTLDEAHEFWGM